MSQPDLSTLSVEILLLELKRRFENMAFVAREPCEYMACDKTLCFVQGDIIGIGELCDILTAKRNALESLDLECALEYVEEEDDDDEDCEVS